MCTLPTQHNTTQHNTAGKPWKQHPRIFLTFIQGGSFLPGRTYMYMIDVIPGILLEYDV